MFCPQCGTESQSAQFCRVCGANLKVIGKAVALSEAVARSDRGPLPKIREMVKGLKVDHVSDEVSGALEKMNQEIARISPESMPERGRRPWVSFRRRKTPAERREDHISKGVISLFSGAGLTLFLFFLSGTLVMKLPPDIVGMIPFEVQQLVRIIWLLGLLPVTSGIGHIIAGLLIRPRPEQPQLEQPKVSYMTPGSVTDHTTNLLDPQKAQKVQK